MSEPITVLIVEDSDDQARLLERYFTRAGCTVVIVSDAEGAMSAYAAEPPHLAVIDLVLPGMDGWTLARRLKADLPGCRVAITSVLEPADFPDADAILPKPFTGAQVRQLLADTLSERGAP